MFVANPARAQNPIRAFLFDLDGVITPTAEVHRQAWAELFREEFEARGATPPYSEDDYFTYLDGKPRLDGVRDLLASRGITLPEGDIDDGPTEETVAGLGNRKNENFLTILDRDGVAAYPGSLRILDECAEREIESAIVTSSRNGMRVLAAAGLGDRFEVVIDGIHASELGLPGKPEPDTYLQAARELGIPSTVCVVVEDAASGVAAGAAGDFGLVIGVDRGVGQDALVNAGADIVVADLAELIGLLPERDAPRAVSGDMNGKGAPKDDEYGE
ncbi:beta-phosphoglucomutase family hydrolase [Gulosibacter molinativorax]|uniref:Beta-phosphoglucomutase n=1 Tax=Gulosibacter molinativorax TaxID=256821 RepID=A0ABT7CAM9_9MICO|nr:beta-phosphoglucomutase family hydrolase [Gulosibacter molinativorax]MDJ1372249.1 beta-phosphoglucomutase family hydrolase [Gulosibacter molinativorax]